MKIKYLKQAKNLFILVLLLNLIACSSKNKRSNLTLFSDQIPIDTALIFAPGVISTEPSHESAIAFNHDMTELYLNRRKPKEKYKIYTMKLVDGKWSNAELASFYSNKDSKYSDFRPRLNPQGDILFFNSDRPLEGETKSSGLHQWYVKKDQDGWGQPIPMSEPSAEEPIVDVSSSEKRNLYFSSNHKDGKPQDEGVYFSRNQDGKYTTAERMGTEINVPGNWNCCPYIAPDESYMIYDSPRDSGYGWVDLYISFNKNGSWTKSYNLGPKVNTQFGEGLATVSPDGKFLFFYRDKKGTGDIYWTDFTKLKKEILEKVNSEK